MDKIGELDFASPLGFIKVKDFLPQVIEEVRADYSTQYAILKKSLAENGQTVPIHVTKDFSRLRDGIHRIAIAKELRWNYMFVSSEKRDNTEWDESEEGRKYWSLWHWRIQGLRDVD